MDTVWMIALVAYLLGSIPFALLATRRLAGADLRQAGSGNLGATNVLRTAGGATAALVLALDVSKGIVAVLLARAEAGAAAPPALAAVAVVLGHVFPVWLRFRGGKGVATAGGAFLVLAPRALAASAVLFVAVAWWTRYVSVASICAASLLPVLSYLGGAPAGTTAAATIVAVVIAWRHRSNLARLKAGRELPLGAGGPR